MTIACIQQRILVATVRNWCDGEDAVATNNLPSLLRESLPEKSSSSFEHLTNMLYAMGGGDPEKGWDYVEKFAGQLGQQ